MNPVELNPNEVGGGKSIILLAPESMPDCQPLSCVIQKYQDDSVATISRWKPSFEERLKLINGKADIIVHIFMFPAPPIAVNIISEEGKS